MKNNKMLMVAMLGLVFGVVSQLEAFEFRIISHDLMPITIKLYEIEFPKSDFRLPTNILPRRIDLLKPKTINNNGEPFSVNLKSNAQTCDVDITYHTTEGIFTDTYRIDRGNKDIDVTFSDQILSSNAQYFDLNKVQNTAISKLQTNR